MKHWSLLTLSLLLSFLLFGQKEPPAGGGFKITGVVLDSLTGQPVEYASITLYKKDDKTPSDGATSGQKGKFVIRDLKPGNYKAVVDFIGYGSRVFDGLSVTDKFPAINLGTILLAKKDNALQSVTVIAPKGLIENKIDKIVFNAEKDLTSQGGVATDILKKVPQVSVDVDGNVELSGSSSIRFLINGRPSSAFGSNISDVLQSIPASQIKSIEVVTNPGAKYDAQGLGGIINIILKKNTLSGINGNLSLTAGTRLENGSFNFNARKGKFGFGAFISGNSRLPAKTPNVTDRTSMDTTAKSNTLLHQDGLNRFRRHGLESGLSFDWTYKNKNSFSGSLGYDNFGNAGNGAVHQTQTNYDQASPANILSSIASLNQTNNKFNFYNIDASLNYKRTFDREDQELELSVTSTVGTNHSDYSTIQSAPGGDSVFGGSRGNNPGKEHETEIQLDYTQPLKKDFIWGMGGKVNIRDITSTADIMTYQPASQTWYTDTSLSNHLIYHQKVYALYSELSFPVFGLFDAKIGARYERTNIDSYYSNASQPIQVPGYNTWVPSVFFSKKFADNQTIKLSYSKRIERPDYRDLNPFINTSDPKNITAGNPALQPEVGNRYELSYSRDLPGAGSFMINLFYRTSDHDIQPYIVYYQSLKIGDSTYSNLAVSTAQNIGLEKNMGVNLFGDLHITPKFAIRSNLFFFERHTINKLDPGYNSSSFNYRLNINTSYQFNNTLAGEFFGNFNSPRHEVQGTYPSFTSYSIALRKQFWNKKGSIALSATNPFGEYVNQRTSVFGPGFHVNGLRRVPFRSIGINFTWKFGKLAFKKEKEDPNNTDNLTPQG